LRFVWVGIKMGMGFVEVCGDLALKFLGTLFGFVLGASLLGEVALTFDIGVLQVIGPSANLPGTGFGEGFEI